MRIEDLLPSSGMPRTQLAPNREDLWFGVDNLVAYRQRGGHALYGETDITYRLNSLGYRAPEFSVQADMRMISIGCSWTFGIGVPEDAVFHELFAARLRAQVNRTVVNWNLGLSATGADYIARVLHLAVPLLDPDIVLILFSGLGRRECMAANNRYITYVPNSVPWDGKTDSVLREVSHHFSSLSSSQDDQLHFFRHYKSIERLLADRCWLFAFLNADEVTSVDPHLNRSKYVHWGRVVDKARDNMHPGPRTHEAIFRSYWERFVANGGLELFGWQVPEATPREF